MSGANALAGRLTKVLASSALLAGALSAGCSGIDMSGGPPQTERQRCEQNRGGGVWVPAAGVCIPNNGGP